MVKLSVCRYGPKHDYVLARQPFSVVFGRMNCQGHASLIQLSVAASQSVLWFPGTAA
jgi:hypothetical protein